jgi:hypothetical protein
MIENKENQKRTDQKNVIQETRVKKIEKGLVYEFNNMICMIDVLTRIDLVPRQTNRAV